MHNMVPSLGMGFWLHCLLHFMLAYPQPSGLKWASAAACRSTKSYLYACYVFSFQMSKTTATCLAADIQTNRWYGQPVSSTDPYALCTSTVASSQYTPQHCEDQGTPLEIQA